MQINIGQLRIDQRHLGTGRFERLHRDRDPGLCRYGSGKRLISGGLCGGPLFFQRGSPVTDARGLVRTGLGFQHLRFGLRNLRLGRGERCHKLTALQFQRGQRQPGEHLPLGHQITDINLKRFNRLPFDQRLHLHLFDRPHQTRGQNHIPQVHHRYRRYRDGGQ